MRKKGVSKERDTEKEEMRVEYWNKQEAEAELEEINNFFVDGNFHNTDTGNASRFVRDHKDAILYCHTRKKWLIWDGVRWAIDTSGEIGRLAEKTIAKMYVEASKGEDKWQRKDLAEHAMRSESRQHREAMINLATSKIEVAKTIDDFDQNKWLLGIQNGAIDLKTGEFRESKREDMISMCMGTSYDPDAQCPQWKVFLNEVLAGDEELISYLQREIGYSLTGDTSEQSFRFLHGAGANGKTVFINVLQALLGDYAQNTPFTTFLIHRQGIRNDLAGLKSARMITAAEPRKGAKFDLSVLKDWTGGDRISARFLFGEYFEFVPQGKLWLNGNHKPIVDETTNAAWRRPRLIPFTVEIPEEKQDPHLSDKLKEELPGILNWALVGLKDYLQNGSNPPAAVLKATEEYRKESDSIGRFLEEYCEMVPGGVVWNKDLREAYKKFCEDMGFDTERQNEFTKRLKNTEGIQWERSRSGVIWHGINLNFDDKTGEKPEWGRFV